MRNRSGSALLLILSVIFVLLAAVLKCWKISSLRIDVQAQREVYYKRFYLTDSLLKIVTAKAINEFDQIFKIQSPIKIELSDAVKNLGYTAYGQVGTVCVNGKVKPNELVISAFLLNGQEIVFKLKCMLSKRQVTGQAKRVIVISGYTIL